MVPVQVAWLLSPPQLWPTASSQLHCSPPRLCPTATSPRHCSPPRLRPMASSRRRCPPPKLLLTRRGVRHASAELRPDRHPVVARRPRYALREARPGAARVRVRFPGLAVSVRSNACWTRLLPPGFRSKPPFMPAPPRFVFPVAVTPSGGTADSCKPLAPHTNLDQYDAKIQRGRYRRVVCQAA